MLRRWPIVAVTVAGAILAALVFLSTAGAPYEATATLRAPTSAASASVGVRPDDLAYNDRLMNTYRRIVESSEFREAVGAASRSTGSADLAVTIEPNTELMRLTARADSARAAARTANKAAVLIVAKVSALQLRSTKAAQQQLARDVQRLGDELRGLRARLASLDTKGRASVAERAALSEVIRARRLDYQGLSQQAAQVRVSGALRATPLVLIDPATASAATSTRRTGLVLVLAVILGLAAGLGIAVLLERRVPQLSTVEDIERSSGDRVVAVIPPARSAAHTSATGSGSDEFRQAFGQLRALVIAQEGGPATSIVVTSSFDGDGKSVVASNLAAAVARSGRRVLLVDADFGSPSAHEFLEMPNSEPGLGTVLSAGDPPLVDAIRPTGVHGLSLLPTGGPTRSPSELLASPRLPAFIAEISGHFDLVVIDAPAVLEASDAASIAPHANAVLLVVGGMPVRERDLKRALRRLRDVGARHVDVVVNLVPRRTQAAGQRRRGREAQRKAAAEAGHGSD